MSQIIPFKTPVQWFYKDSDGEHGPFSSAQMVEWIGFFSDALEFRTEHDAEYHTLGEWRRQNKGTMPFEFPIAAWGKSVVQYAEEILRRQSENGSEFSASNEQSVTAKNEKMTVKHIKSADKNRLNRRRRRASFRDDPTKGDSGSFQVSDHRTYGTRSVSSSSNEDSTKNESRRKMIVINDEDNSTPKNQSGNSQTTEQCISSPRMPGNMPEYRYFDEMLPNDLPNVRTFDNDDSKFGRRRNRKHGVHNSRRRTRSRRMDGTSGTPTEDAPKPLMSLRPDAAQIALRSHLLTSAHMDRTDSYVNDYMSSPRSSRARRRPRGGSFSATWNNSRFSTQRDENSCFQHNARADDHFQFGSAAVRTPNPLSAGSTKEFAWPPPQDSKHLNEAMAQLSLHRPTLTHKELLDTLQAKSAEEFEAVKTMSVVFKSMLENSQFCDIIRHNEPGALAWFQKFYSKDY